jgi:hypothetical protein
VNITSSFGLIHKAARAPEKKIVLGKHAEATPQRRIQQEKEEDERKTSVDFLKLAAISLGRVGTVGAGEASSVSCSFRESGTGLCEAGCLRYLDLISFFFILSLG